MDCTDLQQIEVCSHRGGPVALKSLCKAGFSPDLLEFSADFFGLPPVCMFLCKAIWLQRITKPNCSRQMAWAESLTASDVLLANNFQPIVLDDTVTSSYTWWTYWTIYIIYIWTVCWTHFYQFELNHFCARFLTPGRPGPVTIRLGCSQPRAAGGASRRSGTFESHGISPGGLDEHFISHMAFWTKPAEAMTFPELLVGLKQHGPRPGYIIKGLWCRSQLYRLLCRQLSRGSLGWSWRWIMACLKG